MKKVDKCPKCGTVEPPLTLQLEEPEKYEVEKPIPDKRVYGLICFVCGESIESFTVDNTLKAYKALRDEMDGLYGKSKYYPVGR